MKPFLRIVLFLALLLVWLLVAAVRAQSGSQPMAAEASLHAAPAADADDFVITVKTDVFGPSTTFAILTTGSGYNYNVDCSNDGTNEVTGATGDVTCDYDPLPPGTYTIRIKDNSGEGKKLLRVEQWGTGKWASMAHAFHGCSNLTVPATDVPDLSGVTDMSYMFAGASVFNQNIGGWDTGSVTDMNSMFYNASAFNQNIDNWDTSNVTNMSSMFYKAYAFNQNIGNWNTSDVTDMSSMFYNDIAFNQNIGGWNTASVTNMSNMFCSVSAFNQDIGNWSTANVTDMGAMFDQAGAFNQDIGGWDTGKVTTMSCMFRGVSAFNQDIGNWNTANVTDMSAMFYMASAFNQDIGGWNTGNVTTMYYMFAGASAFNQDIGNWNTAAVTDMYQMFASAYAFNQDIGNWNTANVTNMNGMFYNAGAFNQNIGGWDTGNVTNMSVMFYKASAFNQDISNWNTANVTNMTQMFAGAGAFNQNIGNWNVTALANAASMFSGVTLSTANYDALLIGWGAQALQSGVRFSGGASTYCIGQAARDHMTSVHGWTITDGGKGCEVQCGGVGRYTFSSQSGVVIDVTSTGTNLACLSVEEVSGNHPHATTGIQTGKYWTIHGLQGDATTPATQDYLLNLTLPTSFTPDAGDKLCHYTGSGWDCAASSFDGPGQTVTRNSLSALSDWAVGDNVTATAVTLRALKAAPAFDPVAWFVDLLRRWGVTR